MSKGLEALKEIKRKPFSWEKLKDSLDTIESELKRLEEIDNGAIVPIHINRYNELSDKEEALEIIKEYIHIYCVAPNDRGGVRIWFTQDGKHYIDISQEKYDLLKEVLL